MQKPVSAVSAIHRDQEKSLYSNAEAAEYIGITPSTLEVWRSVKRFIIPYIKVGRLVKYRKADLDAFLLSQTVEG